jgi:hypothetical protein
MLYISTFQTIIRGVVNYPSIFLSPIVSSLPYQSIGINQNINFKNKELCI